MAVLDRTTYKGTYNTTFADNTTQDIEAVDMRDFKEDTADSFVNKVTDGYFAQLTTSTSTTAYVGTAVPNPVSYATGQKFQVKIHATSTGAATLNLNSIGAKKIFISPTVQAGSGNLLINQIYLMVYDAALDGAVGGFLIVGSGGGHTVEDEGTPLTQRTKLNFVGAGVTATDDSGDDATVITIPDVAPKYVIDQATASTAGGTITLDMNSQIQRSHVGSATFATAKVMALSNTTNSLFFNFFFEVTNVAAVLTFPSDWESSSFDFDGADWTPPAIGKYELGGSFDDVNNVWSIKIDGPRQ